MRLHLYRHLWGLNGTWEQLFPGIAGEGYHGIEAPVPAVEHTELFRVLLHENHLRYIAMGFTHGRDPTEHLASLRPQLMQAKACAAELVNVHAGSDRWDIATGERFLAEAMTLAAGLGIRVVFETHRGRVLFNQRDTMALCRALPDLRLTLDISHFVVVGERLLDDELDGIPLLA